MASHAAILARFSMEFGVPFLLGRRAVVGSPLGADGLLAIRPGIAVDTGLVDACARQLEQAAFLADLTPAPFDEDAGTLLHAAYELFACTHPQASAFYARAHSFARAAASSVNALPRTLDPHRLLTRHLIVQRAFSATRTDVHVRWWTGHADFFGEDAPRRLTAWPSMRRVNIDRQTTPMWKLALATGDEELRVARAALLVALLDSSPLTRMVLLGEPVQKALGFSLVLPYRIMGSVASPLDALEDRALARGVTDHLLERGMEGAASALALALLQALRERTSPRVLRRAAELCTHLAYAACLIEGEVPGTPQARGLRELLDDDPTPMNEALRAYWAVVASTIALDGAVFALPAVEDLSDSAAAVWMRLQDRLRHRRIAAVAEPLERELRRRLPPASEASSSSTAEPRPKG